MALGATIHTFDVQLADVDRGVYDDFTLRVARHPSETDVFMLTRVLAYCLEYTEGIGFSEGISATDEPAVSVRDLTGRLLVWIEIGAPDAEKLHLGSRQAERTVVYTHRVPERIALQWEGKRIHRAEEIAVRSFDVGFVESVATGIGRRNTLGVSLIEGQLYLDLNGASSSSPVHERSVA